MAKNNFQAPGSVIFAIINLILWNVCYICFVRFKSKNSLSSSNVQSEYSNSLTLKKRNSNSMILKKLNLNSNSLNLKKRNSNSSTTRERIQNSNSIQL